MEPNDQLDERAEAQIIDHRHIDQHETMVTILAQQSIRAHNRSVETDDVTQQYHEAELILRLSDQYATLLTL